MKLSEVKQNLKKDPPGSYVILIHRKIGMFVTWLLLNLFPGINANAVTVAMGFLNVIAGALSCLGILWNNPLFAILGFVVFFASLSLDCADGNIARIKKTISYKGVLIDRLVHNSTHPLIFISIGISIYLMTSNLVALCVFAVSAVFVEHAPVESSINNVKISFVNQLINKKTKNFTISDYHSDAPSAASVADGQPKKVSTKKKLIGLCMNTAKAFFSIDVLFIIVIVDCFVFPQTYLLCTVFTAMYLLLKLKKDLFMHESLEKFMEKLSLQDWK